MSNTATTVVLPYGTGNTVLVPNQGAAGPAGPAGPAGSGGGGSSLAPTAVKTVNYTAAASDLVPVDTTAGNVTITLPTAPADKAQVAVKHVIRGATNTVTVACAGSDVLNKAGGLTSGTLTLLNQGVTLQYKATGAIWYAVSDDTPLSGLDTRYPALSTVTAAADLLVGSGAGAVARLGVGTDATVLTADSTQTAGLKWTAPPAPGPTYNLLPQNYKKWRKALSKVRSGTGNAVLFCVGDSTTEGNTATTFGQNYPSILAGLLNSYYVPAAQTWMLPHNDGGSTNDPRVTVGSPWAVTADFWQNTTTAATLSFAPSTGSCAGPASTDTFDIYYFFNAGTFDVNINGGATLATSTANAGTVNKLTVTATASGSNTLNIVSKNNGNVFVMGVNAYLSTLKQVQVGNRGVGASKSADWALGSPAVYQYRAWYTQYSPGLTIVDLGINDAGASVTTATYQTNMQTVITRALTPGDVMLKAFCPSNGAPYLTVEPTYLPILNALATWNNGALLDIYTRWVSYAVSNPLGYYNDALHPSTFGYSDVAQAVFNTLKTL